MKFRQIKDRFIVRLEKGDRVIESLQKFCKEKSLKCGYLLGLGAVSEAELALYRLKDKKYFSKKIKEPMEMIVLNGNISEMDNEPYLHIHGIFSDRDMRTFSGHVKEATIAATGEITIWKFDGKIRRSFDKAIGLNLYDI